jgi:hypothetical protein
MPYIPGDAAAGGCRVRGARACESVCTSSGRKLDYSTTTTTTTTTITALQQRLRCIPLYSVTLSHIPLHSCSGQANNGNVEMDHHLSASDTTTPFALKVCAGLTTISLLTLLSTAAPHHREGLRLRGLRHQRGGIGQQHVRPTACSGSHHVSRSSHHVRSRVRTFRSR